MNDGRFLYHLNLISDSKPLVLTILKLLNGVREGIHELASKFIRPLRRDTLIEANCEEKQITSENLKLTVIIFASVDVRPGPNCPPLLVNGRLRVRMALDNPSKIPMFRGQ